MKLLNNLFGKKETAKKSSAVPYVNLGEIGRGSFAEYLLGQSSYFSADRAMRFYRQSSAVAMAVDMIADEIEKIRPVLRDESGKFVPDAECLSIINRPNGFETRHELVGQLVRNYLLTHDAFLYAEGAFKRPPLGLFVVPNQDVTITENGVDKYPRSFSVGSGMAKGTYNRQELNKAMHFTQGGMREVYQISGYSSHTSRTYSDSPLQAVALEVQQLINSRYHNLRLLENGGRLSLIAVFQDIESEDQIEVLRDNLNSQMAGPHNAGKIAVIGANEMELKEVGTNNKDMDFFNLDAAAQQCIARRYKIPLPLINNDASTFNNLEQSVYHFYDMAVLPVFEKVFSGLSHFLLPRYGIDPAKARITYNPDDIEALRGRRIAELSKLIKDNAITINEYRDNISFEPVEGGDDIYMPATMIPVARDVFTLTDIDNPEQVARDGET